jgi:serine/threonine protein kinase
MGVVLVFKGGKDVGRRVALAGSVLKVGSSPQADLVIADDPLIEPDHFVIQRDGDDTYEICNRSSQQGTFVNSQKVDAVRLREGDVIRAGLTVFQATLVGSDARSPTVLLAGTVDEAYEPLNSVRTSDDTQAESAAGADQGDDLLLRASLSAVVSEQGYELGRILGSGSFGRVYRAKRVDDGTTVAVKVLDGITSESPKKLQLFVREIAIHQKLDHPHIVRMLSTGGLDEKIAWFVMEFVEGRNLDRIVRESGEMLSVADACRITMQILHALEYAHNYPAPDGPFVHRDVKMSNILVAGGAGSYVAKLADLGLAKNFALAGYSGITATGKACGTLEFMSREQAIDSKYAGPEVDLHAMGVVLFFCLTGRTMYDVSHDAAPSELLNAVLTRKILPLRSCRPDLPESLQDVFDRAVGRDSIRRFRTARQMIHALEQVACSYQTGEAPSDVGDRPNDP